MMGMGMCPGMCQGPTCQVDCDGMNCKNLMMDVSCGPPDMYSVDCHVRCLDAQCGAGTDILCPLGDADCRVDCTGPNSCDGAIVRCGGGPCTVVCAPGACDDLEVYCGAKRCSVNCGMSTNARVFNSNQTCQQDFMAGCVPM